MVFLRYTCKYIWQTARLRFFLGVPDILVMQLLSATDVNYCSVVDTLHTEGFMLVDLFHGLK